jgi:hypothetical protein
MNSAIRRVFFLLLASAGFLLLGNCSKGKGGATGPDDTDTVGTEISTLVGQVQDDTGGALAGVIVSAGSGQDTTDANGLFTLPSAKVPKGRAFIIARKTGYFDGSRAEAPGSNGATFLRLRMMKKDFKYSVSGTAGGTVKVAGGAELDLPAGGFVTPSGAAYTGTVLVAANYLNPDSSTFWDFFAGDNQGREANGATTALISLGVMRVEIQGGGQPLRLASGKTATLSYPKPAGGDAPTSMPLWYFDAEIGQWHEEGSATLKDGVYQGTVTHFSDWNLDYKGPSWDFHIRILCDSVPLEGVVVRSYMNRIGISDAAGVIHFINAPRDMGANKLDVLAKDNGGLFYKNTTAAITYQSGKSDTLDVELDSPCPASISGRLIGCDDKAIEGWAAAQAGGSSRFAFTATGKFVIRVPFAVALTVNAGDRANNNMLPISITALAENEQKAIGDLKICGTKVEDWVDVKHDSLDFIRAWAMSPDGSLIVSTSRKPGLLLFNTKTGAVIQEIPLGYTPNFGNLKISADNTRLLVFLTGHPIEVWDITAKPAKKVTALPTLSHAEISDDAKTVFGSSGFNSPDVKVALYSAVDGSEVKVLHPAHFKGVDPQGGNPSLKLLHEHGAFAYQRSDTASIFSVWSLEGDTLIREIKSPLTPGTFGYFLYYNPAGDKFWISSTLDSADIYDMTTGEKVNTFAPFHAVANTRSISAAVTDEYIFSTNTISGVQLIQQFRLDDLTLVGTYPIPEQPEFNRRTGTPVPSRDGSMMAADVRMPSVYPATLSGWRVYKLK